MKNFKLAVYSSIPHLRQKGQKVDNTPSEASGKYNTITVKSQTVIKADCVGSLWCLLVLNLAVACVASVFENDEEGEGEKGRSFFFSPYPSTSSIFFFSRNNDSMLRAITGLETLASCYPGCYRLLIITRTLVHAPTSSWTPQ